MVITFNHRPHTVPLHKEYPTPSLQVNRKTYLQGNPSHQSYRSFKNSWGTSALIIEGGEIFHPIISATSNTPGNPEEQEAYWIELSGILHAIMIIDNICYKFNITEGEITATHDGIDAIIMEMDKDTYF